jgi:hypothetical protein
MSDLRYYWNDSEIDEKTFNKLNEEHRLWVIEDEKKKEALRIASAPPPEKKTRAKKSK